MKFLFYAFILNFSIRISYYKANNKYKESIKKYLYLASNKYYNGNKCILNK